MSRHRARRDAHRAPPPRDPPADQAEAPAVRYGILLAWAFVAIGVLLLALGALGRGWPHLLGALDFVALGTVLLWAVRHGRGPVPGNRNGA